MTWIVKEVGKFRLDWASWYLVIGLTVALMIVLFVWMSDRQGEQSQNLRLEKLERRSPPKQFAQTFSGPTSVYVTVHEGASAELVISGEGKIMNIKDWIAEQDPKTREMYKIKLYNKDDAEHEEIP